jgi:hypothetical protein
VVWRRRFICECKAGGCQRRSTTANCDALCAQEIQSFLVVIPLLKANFHPAMWRFKSSHRSTETGSNPICPASQNRLWARPCMNPELPEVGPRYPGLLTPKEARPCTKSVSFRRPSLVAFFQFPFSTLADRFENWQRPVRGWRVGAVRAGQHAVGPVGRSAGERHRQWRLARSVRPAARNWPPAMV